MTVPTERFDYNDARSILERKGLFEELNYLITNLESVRGNYSDKTVRDRLERLGWKTQASLFKGTGYMHDGFKDGVLFESDQNSLDSVHRNFLRAQVLFLDNNIECLVQVVRRGVGKEPNFDSMRRDIGLFRRVLSVPIYLMGLDM